MIRLRFSIPLNHRARLLGALSILSAAAVLAVAANPPKSNPDSASAMQIIEVPARIADLAFSYIRPLDFRPLELSPDLPDFENPAAFFAIEKAAANHGAVQFVVLARPAYGDGTVEDWAGYLTRENGITVTALQLSSGLDLPGIKFDGVQETAAGTVRLRSLLLEDGQRMLWISVRAPDAVWTNVESTLDLMLKSFRLTEPRGNTVTLTRAEAAAVEPPPAVASPLPAAERVRPAAVALAESAETLDPEHPLNQRLREQGAGFTPRVLETYPEEKYAVVGAGGVRATFHIPFGWHALDDGRRVLVFDATGRIQVSVNLRATDGDARRLLREILADLQREQPAVEPTFSDVTRELPTLIVHNFRDGDDVLVQAYVVRPVPDSDEAHVGRVTAAPADISEAMNLANIILHSLRTDAVPARR